MCLSPPVCIYTWALAFKVWAGVAKLKGLRTHMWLMDRSTQRMLGAEPHVLIARRQMLS